MNYQKFSLAFGLVVWLVATLIVSFWGHLFFSIENNIAISLLFIGTIPPLYLLIQWVFNRFQLNQETQFRSSVLMALPGMLCDVFCIQFHSFVFPLLTIEQVVLLGAWIIWTYFFTILIGLISK
ncbi:MAG: DUF5367 family protein [Aureispira sp.]